MTLDPYFAKAGHTARAPAARAAWRYLRAHFGGDGGRVALCVAAAAGQSLLALPMIPLVRLAFDRAIPRGDLGLLLAIGGGLAALRLVAGAAVVVTRRLVVGVKSRVVLDLRRDLIERLYLRPHLSHVRAETQPLAAHLVIDAERIDAMIDQGLGTALPALLTGVVLGGALLWLNPWLTLAGLAMLPPVALAARWAAGRARADYRRYHDAHDDFMRGVRFMLDAFALTRARGAETAEVARQTGTLQRLRAAAVTLATDNSLTGQLQSATLALAGVALLVAGGVAVGRHALSVGGLLAFFAAAAVAASQIDRLISVLPSAMEGTAALGRLYAHIAAAPAAPYVGRRRLEWTGRVALEGVTFAYGAEPVLQEVSLELAPGARVGLTGSNGAGKTTIVSLILGLQRPGSGRLTADGVAYDAVDLPALRRMIGLVPQDPVFFDGSVLDNIVYGAPKVGRADVAELVEAIGAGPMLARLEGGLDAPLGESGLRLSGGERQMVALLRAMAARPRLLLLDEPTNHLDRAAAGRLQSVLAAAPGKPGLLMISHQAGALSGLDRSYRLSAGRLAHGAPV